MEISERKRRILKAIIELYVDTAEPVGSKAIADNSQLSLSSATIRNEMAELTRMGCLEQPHTSAGRIPSPGGYRIYVNELMKEHRLSVQEIQEINRTLRQRLAQLDALISDAGKVIAELTSYPAYALTAAAHKPSIKRFDFIYIDKNTVIAVAMLENDEVKNKLMHFPDGIEEEYLRKLSAIFNANFTGLTAEELDARQINAAERAANDTQGAVAALAGFALSILLDVTPPKTYLSGTSYIFDHPEYRDLRKARRLLDYLTDAEELQKLPVPGDESGIKITIGPENLAEELRDSSVVVASCELGNDTQGLIGIVGPTRMDYARVTARLAYISRGLRMLALGGNIPPPDNRNNSGKD